MNAGSLLSCCFFFLGNYLKVFENTFKVFTLTITFPSSTKSPQNINLIIWGKILTYVDNFLSNAYICILLFGVWLSAWIKSRNWFVFSFEKRICDPFVLHCCLKKKNCTQPHRCKYSRLAHCKGKWMICMGRVGPRTVFANLGTCEKSKTDYALISLVSTLRICFKRRTEDPDAGTKHCCVKVTVTLA